LEEEDANGEDAPVVGQRPEGNQGEAKGDSSDDGETAPKELTVLAADGAADDGTALSKDGEETGCVVVEAFLDFDEGDVHILSDQYQT
jgi:hypothetical protein